MRSVDDAHVERGRQRSLQRRQQRLDAVDHLDHVRARLPLHVQDDRRRAVDPRAELRVFRAGDDRRDVRQHHRAAVLVRDDRALVRVGVGQLVVRVDRVRVRRTVEVALRRVDVEIGDRGAQVVEIQAVRRQRKRVCLNPHGRALAARQAHEADAADLRDLLREPGVGDVLHLGERQRLRCDRERDDRRVGGVDLRVDRRRGQVGRQQVARGVDRGLHFLFGDIERQVEVELQRDHRRARRTLRRHLVQRRHLPELPLERRRHRRRHHVGARAGIERLHLDRRVVDFRQRRKRQEAQRDETDQHDRRHQQGGADRAQDKGAGWIHAVLAVPIIARLAPRVFGGDRARTMRPMRRPRLMHPTHLTRRTHPKHRADVRPES